MNMMKKTNASQEAEHVDDLKLLLEAFDRVPGDKTPFEMRLLQVMSRLPSTEGWLWLMVEEHVLSFGGSKERNPFGRFEAICLKGVEALPGADRLSLPMCCARYASAVLAAAVALRIGQKHPLYHSYIAKWTEALFPKPQVVK